MSSMVLSGDTSGAVTLTVPAVAGTNTITLPAATGTVMVSGNAPAFSAYLSGSNQSVSAGAWTKVRLDAESFDTNNCFDSTTNYRFTPTVAGYYQLNGQILHSATGTRPSEAYTAIYQNGVSVATGSLNIATANSIIGTVTSSKLIYFNGTTDYAELYGYPTGGTGNIFSAGGALTYLTGTLVRNA